MNLVSDYSRKELETICPVAFTLQDLRVLQLALAGDTFAPGSQWNKAFQAVMTKIDTSLDELRVQVLEDTAS